MFLSRSYFHIPNPVSLLDTWLNPARFQQFIKIGNKILQVTWTKRAQQQLDASVKEMTVEMQIYFSCVVQKRVVFHEDYPYESYAVTDQLRVGFRAVESDTCNPTEFAKQHPVKKQLSSTGASKMQPSHLVLDYKNNQWCGRFSI